MLTAAVRDLHLCYPGKFLTDVRTPCPDLWLNNPYITPLNDHTTGVRKIQCHYPLIHSSNTQPYHFIHGFIHYLNSQLGLDVKPSVFRGDLHLSDEERTRKGQVATLIGEDTPYWIINAGGKYDFTAKWWSNERYQAVVDHFRERILFVQIGESGHHHPPLQNVLDLRGKTTLRELVLLTHHAQGILTPVSLPMHLAAAVDIRPGLPKNRACVVVAGGREPMQWEAYPHHQFIHTNGALLCCDNGGCWKSRVKKLNDGSEQDRAHNICVDVVGDLPRCLDMIDAAEVIRRIELYFRGGALSYLKKPAAKQNGHSALEETLHPGNARQLAEAFIKNISPYPEKRYTGRGIVLCAGGSRYFPSAWINLQMLRRTGCELPVEIWHLGPEELDDQMRALLEPLGVLCVDALALRREYPCRTLRGWELKAYALLHSQFEEVLLLDADNMAVTNPTPLFEHPEYHRYGAVLWPDQGRFGPQHPAWELTGVEYRDEPECESGQLLWHKRRCWQAANLALWYNAYSDFFYRFVHGDKDLFRLALHKTKTDFAMAAPVFLEKTPLGNIFYQKDFNGNRLFQHGRKWSLKEQHKPVSSYWFEDYCIYYLNELKKQWNGQIELAVQRHPVTTN